jgi:P-aminobenzoate N-oxygenase AurF
VSVEGPFEQLGLGEPDEVEVTAMTRALRNWYEAAGVRADPRRVLRDERREGAFYWPPHLAPLVRHPAVMALGEEAQEEILVRHLFQYLDLTAHYEMQVVNRASEILANGRSGLYLPEAVRLDAYKIYVDEGYHALYSRDLIFQVEGAAGIGHIPSDFERYMSFMRRAQEEVAADNLGDMAMLLVVVVFETLVTATLTQIPKQRTVISTVRELVTDHAEDEARHSVFFSELFGYLWGQLDQRRRRLLGPLIPGFIIGPLAPPMEAMRGWLARIGIEPGDIEDVIAESYPREEVQVGMAQTARATLRLFGRHGLYDDPATREAFAAHGLLPADA